MIHAIATFFVGIAAAANAFLGGLLSPNYGTTLTTINGSDTISSSRTVINDNFTALEASKLDKTATTLPSSFLASSLTSVGTIASGVWNGTPVGVAYGGTGTTSPSTHYVMLGNGTSGLKVVSGLGTSGQFLTSNGAGAAPTWQTSAVNQSDDYNWTGEHIFSATTTFSGEVNGIITGNYFGNGEDLASTTAGTTSLSEDMYFTNLTVPLGATLKTNGYKVWVSGTLTNAGTIQANGGAGGDGGTPTAGTAGVIAHAAGTLAAGEEGKAGGVGSNSTGSGEAAGTNGDAVNPSLGSSGSAGGAGSFSGASGGTAGTATGETALLFSSTTIGTLSSSSVLSTFIKVLGYGLVSKETLSGSAGSGGGGGGASDSDNTGGGGGGSGASGGVIEIIAKNIINSGTISANGGKGGNGGGCTGSAAGAGGGGGGGAGGVIVLGYHSLTNTGTISATGGAIGTGGPDCGRGSGGDGTIGTDGKIYKFQI